MKPDDCGHHNYWGLSSPKMTPKLIITYGLYLALLIECFVNIMNIDKDEAMDPKEQIPQPLVLTYPVVNPVHILKLTTEVNPVPVTIV